MPRIDLARNLSAVLATLPEYQSKIPARTGLGVATVSRILKQLSEEGKVHVVRKRNPWKGGPPTSLYALGPAPEGHVVSMPTPKSNKYHDRRRRERQRKARALAAKLRAAPLDTTFKPSPPPPRDILTAHFFAQSIA